MDVHTLPLSRGMSTVVDLQAFEAEHTYYRRDGEELHCRPCNLRWHAAKNRNFFYAISSVRGWAISLHRLIVDAPRGMLVDHHDRDTLNNRLTNLRICDHRQNMANVERRGGTSTFKGVYFSKADRRWIAQVHMSEGSKRVCKVVGRFFTELEAAVAYDREATAYFGEFARLNFPTQVAGS